eukprot:TRINITY_DN1575_c0_g4_i1.p1 TRINITY_DN1575_c0_g4~~TRINITY_DN1575_c0_g4_i1.p1  ORF type:complete len:911 (+),score=199.96 TRINITY_DN1575_c0_g4_i1:110-2842(+)
MVLWYVILFLSIGVAHTLHLPNADIPEDSFVEASSAESGLPSGAANHRVSPAGDANLPPIRPDPAPVLARRGLPASKDIHAGGGWSRRNGSLMFARKPYATFASHKGFWSMQEAKLTSKVRHDSQISASKRESTEPTDFDGEQFRSGLEEDKHAKPSRKNKEAALLQSKASDSELSKIREEAMLSKKRAETAKKTLHSLMKKHAEVAKQFEKAEEKEASVLETEMRRAKDADERKHKAEIAVGRSTLMEERARSDKAQANKLFRKAHLVLASAEKDLQEGEMDGRSISALEEDNRGRVRSAQSVLQTVTERAQRLKAAAADARIAYKKAQEALRKYLAAQKAQETKAAANLKTALKRARLIAHQARDVDAKSLALHTQAKELWGEAGSVLHEAQSEGTRAGINRTEEPELRKSVMHNEQILSTVEKLASAEQVHVARAKKIVQQEKMKLRELLHRHAASALASVQRLRKAKAKARMLSQRAEKQSKQAEKLARQAALDKFNAAALVSGRASTIIDASWKSAEQRRLRADIEERIEKEEQKEQEAKREARVVDEEVRQSEKDMEELRAEWRDGNESSEKANSERGRSDQQQLSKKMKNKCGSSKGHQARVSTRDAWLATGNNSHARSHQENASALYGQSMTETSSDRRTHQNAGPTKKVYSSKGNSKKRQPTDDQATRKGSHSTSQQEVVSSKRDQSRGKSAKKRQRSSQVDPRVFVEKKLQDKDRFSKGRRKKVSLGQPEDRIGRWRESSDGGSSSDHTSSGEYGPRSNGGTSDWHGGRHCRKNRGGREDEFRGEEIRDGAVDDRLSMRDAKPESALSFHLLNPLPPSVSRNTDQHPSMNDMNPVSALAAVKTAPFGGITTGLTSSMATTDFLQGTREISARRLDEKRTHEAGVEAEQDRRPDGSREGAD